MQQAAAPDPNLHTVEPFIYYFDAGSLYGEAMSDETLQIIREQHAIMYPRRNDNVGEE